MQPRVDRLVNIIPESIIVNFDLLTKLKVTRSTHGVFLQLALPLAAQLVNPRDLATVFVEEL